MKKSNIFNNKIGVIGLGYVGLPLALEFSKKFDVTGFDTNLDKIKNLKKKNNIVEIQRQDYRYLDLVNFTSSKNLLKKCNIFIITVPTPIYTNKKPDLRSLISATKIVASVLKPKDLIIYESTVYPGTVEEICVPILKKNSQLDYLNVSNELKKKNMSNYFSCGYSSERMNPSDRTHILKNVNKIVAGSTTKTSIFMKRLYSTIIKAKIYNVQNIKTAEASKMLENIQRDLNIALMNEVSVIFNKMGVNTLDVIKAAATKWNFSIFYPGLVGGHCIGVDPYYMSYKAQKIGAKSQLITSGRVINDNMAKYVSKVFLRSLKKINNNKKKILIMGISFKENCPDIRNSKIIDLYKFIAREGISVDIYDPIVNPKELKKMYKLKLVKKIYKNTYDGIIIAVRHLEFKNLGLRKIKNFCKKKSIIFDLKSLFLGQKTDFSL
jgi:UDP-N-acetyl-D-galactosamine dehydrogenase